MGLTFFYILHVVVCVVLVCVILFQDGKTGGLVSVSETSNQMFGAGGASSFLTKLTSGLAIIFMISSFFLAFRSSPSDKSIASDFMPPEQSSVPAEVQEGVPGTTAAPGSVGNEVQITDDQGNVIGTQSLSESLDGFEIIQAEDLPEEIRGELNPGNPQPATNQEKPEEKPKDETKESDKKKSEESSGGN